MPVVSLRGGKGLNVVGFMLCELRFARVMNVSRESAPGYRVQRSCKSSRAHLNMD